VLATKFIEINTLIVGSNAISWAGTLVERGASVPVSRGTGLSCLTETSDERQKVSP
jgi:hypothetical protein